MATKSKSKKVVTPSKWNKILFEDPSDDEMYGSDVVSDEDWVESDALSSTDYESGSNDNYPPDSKHKTNILIDEPHSTSLQQEPGPSKRRKTVFVPETSSDSSDEVLSALAKRPKNQKATKRKDNDNSYFHIEEGNPVLTPIQKILKGKNNHKWTTDPPKKNPGRKERRNILCTGTPGPKGPALIAKSPEECFKLFFTTEMLNETVMHTNNEITRTKTNYTVQTATYNLTCTDEVNALIGILILSSALKNNHLTVEEMWNCKLGVSAYRAAMSKERFKYLVNCLRFDDKTTRVHRKIVDPFTAIRDLWEMFISQCRQLYNPSAYCTIDEQLLGFRGRCPFRMYIPNKPAKYGIKLVMMCDANTKYLVDASPYLGKGTKTNGLPLGEYYVTELTKTIHGSNRNVTTDNWFTSVPLVKKLLEDPYKLTLVGTLKKNKSHIPSIMLEKKNRPIRSSVFCFDNEVTMVSYRPKRNKFVLMLSSMHAGKSMTESTNKPAIIMMYNDTKGGVDTFDQMCGSASCSRKTRRWPLCIFYGMLNAAGINSFIIYSTNRMKDNEKPIQRRLYLEELAFSLMEPWMNQRIQVATLPRSVKMLLQDILQKNAPAVGTNMGLPKPKRCGLCPSKKDRKTSYQCHMCQKPMCMEHRAMICSDCI